MDLCRHHQRRQVTRKVRVKNKKFHENFKYFFFLIFFSCQWSECSSTFDATTANSHSPAYRDDSYPSRPTRNSHSLSLVRIRNQHEDSKLAGVDRLRQWILDCCFRMLAWLLFGELTNINCTIIVALSHE
jgi:hypothetical protein